MQITTIVLSCLRYEMEYPQNNSKASYVVEGSIKKHHSLNLYSLPVVYMDHCSSLDFKIRFMWTPLYIAVVSSSIYDSSSCCCCSVNC